MSEDPKASDGGPEEVRMTFGEHLEELRSRLLRAIVATVAAFIAAFCFADALMAVATRPYRVVTESLRQDPSLKAIGPGQGFFAYMQVCLVAGLAVAGPVWIHQLWAFIAAGLYSRERRFVYRFFPLALVLFAAGVALGYFVMVPLGLRFLLTFADPALVQNWIGLPDYLAFLATFTLLLGAAFELPVVMLVLARIGVISAEAFAARRKFFILGAVIVAAVLTPPDPVSQLLLATPLVVLYELGIVLARAGRSRAPAPRPAGTLGRRLRVAAVVVLLGLLGIRLGISEYRTREADGRVLTEGSEDDPMGRFAILRALIEGGRLVAAVDVEDAGGSGGDDGRFYAVLVERDGRDRVELWRVHEDPALVHPLPEADGWRNALLGRGQLRFARGRPHGSAAGPRALAPVEGRRFLPCLLETAGRASEERRSLAERILSTLAGADVAAGAAGEERLRRLGAWCDREAGTLFPRPGVD